MKWVISDIHGMFYTFLKLLTNIEEIDSDPTFICVGDYCDRGPFTRQVVDLCIEMQKDGHIFCRGNHDDVLDWILNGFCKSDLREQVVGQVNSMSVIQWWTSNGLIEALKSYDFDTNAIFRCRTLSDYDNLIRAIRDKIPENHKSFFANLPLSWENDSHFVLHAYVKPSVIFNRFGLPSYLNKMDRIMESMWTRFSDNEISASAIQSWDKIGVFGHTPTVFYNSKEPIKVGKIRLIDTGAVFGEKMTAYCLDTDEFIFARTQREDND